MEITSYGRSIYVFRIQEVFPIKTYVARLGNGIFICIKDGYLGKHTGTIMLRGLNMLESFFCSDLPGEVLFFNQEDEYYVRGGENAVLH